MRRAAIEAREGSIEPASAGARSGAKSEERLLDLMQHYKDSLYGYVLALTSSPEIALDCTQDAFLRAHENLKRGKPVNARWLHTVARNRAIDELRRRQRERPELETVEDRVDEDEGPSQRILDARQALARMTPEEREILHLFVVDRLRAAEIAEMLGTTATAVRMRISRARHHFRLLYGDMP